MRIFHGKTSKNRKQKHLYLLTYIFYYKTQRNNTFGKKKKPKVTEKNEGFDSDDEIVVRNQILKY